MTKAAQALSARVPNHLERLFRCLDEATKRCPHGCGKRLPLAAMIVHLNDDHRRTREQIAEWLTQNPRLIDSVDVLPRPIQTPASMETRGSRDPGCGDRRHSG